MLALEGNYMSVYPKPVCDSDYCYSNCRKLFQNG